MSSIGLFSQDLQDAGHEAVGAIAAVGNNVTTLKVGQRVGLGWFSRSCLACEWCMSGDHNLCLRVEGTIVGRHGAFADKVRAHYSWAIPLPETLDPAKAGPLFCGGITVFNPIVQLNIQPTDRVGVIGIGGLGHLALRFLHEDIPPTEHKTLAKIMYLDHLSRHELMHLQQGTYFGHWEI